MRLNTAKVPLAWWTGGLTFFSAHATSTARADQPATPNIPVAAEKNQLPAPYSPWHGKHYAKRLPPGELESPPPLARPVELSRRPFEVGAALAAFLPSCSAGSIDNRGCLTVTPGAGLHATLVHRIGWFFAVGAEGAISGFGEQGHGAFSAAGGAARFLGVVGRVYFAESGGWDPYLSLALGYGTLSLPGTATQHERGDSDGLGARVAGGFDYLFSSHLRGGPALGFAHFIAWREERCLASICRAERLTHGRLLGFATLSLSLTASFGDAL
jgi:hypothetical protein